jgi:hypothetical protein
MYANHQTLNRWGIKRRSISARLLKRSNRPSECDSDELWPPRKFSRPDFGFRDLRTLVVVLIFLTVRQGYGDSHREASLRREVEPRDEKWIKKLRPIRHIPEGGGESVNFTRYTQGRDSLAFSSAKKSWSRTETQHFATALLQRTKLRKMRKKIYISANSETLDQYQNFWVLKDYTALCCTDTVETWDSSLSMAWIFGEHANEPTTHKSVDYRAFR